MAIIKHSSSKNSDYNAVLDYYQFKHNENQELGVYQPVMSEEGLMQYRENYAIKYIDATGVEKHPELWATNCLKVNYLYGKNKEESDIKNHHYIISFTEADRLKLTKEKMLEIGTRFVEENLKGYDCLIAVHRDTDNDHIHITLNSVRRIEREQQTWMQTKKGKILDSEYAAGGKHQDGPKFRAHCNDWLLNVCKEYGLDAKDNNAIAAERRQKRYTNRNEKIKDAILYAAAKSKDFEELKKVIKDEFDIDLIIRGNTISAKHPEREKATRLKTLGLTKEDITDLFTGEEYNLNPYEKEKERIRKYEEEERKKYIEWVKYRRQRNNAKAEEMTEKVEALISQDLHAVGIKYNRSDYKELYYLIRQLKWLRAALETEQEKAERLRDTWQRYMQAVADSNWIAAQKEKDFLRWCGVDADSEIEYKQLEQEIAIIEHEEECTDELIKILQSEAKQWKGINTYTYFEKQKEWLEVKEQQLNHQFQKIKKNRKKLGEIRRNCEAAAERRAGESYSELIERYSGDSDQMTEQENNNWANYRKFNEKFWNTVFQDEKELNRQWAELEKEKEKLYEEMSELYKNGEYDVPPPQKPKYKKPEDISRAILIEEEGLAFTAVVDAIFAVKEIKDKLKNAGSSLNEKIEAVSSDKIAKNRKNDVVEEYYAIIEELEKLPTNAGKSKFRKAVERATGIQCENYKDAINYVSYIEIEAEKVIKDNEKEKMKRTINKVL